jgi:ParD-like antitoxin of type II bacterial toxin-antitoxin system
MRQAGPRKKTRKPRSSTRPRGAARQQRAAEMLTPVALRFTPDEQALYTLLAARARAGDRSLSGQIKHYLRLALIAEDNPELPLSLIHGILEAQAELKAGLAEPYHWGVSEPAASRSA